MDHMTAIPAMELKSRKTFTVPTWVLIFIQTFMIWQMGVIYYSSKVFTVSGVTPLPVSVDTAALPIAMGYIAGAILAFCFPKRVGLWAKLLTGASLVIILLMFLPFPPAALAALYYASVFTCVVFISVSAVLSINLYSLKTALKDGILATIVASPFIALLHFGPLSDNFRVFNVCSAIIQVLILFGLSRIPSKAGMEFIPPQKKLSAKEKITPPIILIVASLLLFTVFCLCVLFSTTTAESIPGGISIFYVSSTLWGLLFAYLYFKKNISPFNIFTAFLGIAAIGFILWLFPLPAIMPASIALQGVTICLCNLGWFIAAVLFERWNAKVIAPATVLIALVTVLLHSTMLELLRSHTNILYAVYACVALFLLVLHFLSAPYFFRVWLDSENKGERPTKEPPDSQPAVIPGNAETTTPSVPVGEIAQAWASGSLPDTLTKREREIALLVARGYDDGNIAQMLFITESTVKTHLKKVYTKFGVHSRVALVGAINKLEGVHSDSENSC